MNKKEEPITAAGKDFVAAFKTAGCRLTRQREAILAYLTRASRGGVHPSVRQVHEKLKDRHRGISLATVYNTMGSLVRLGLVKVMEFESGDNRYETNLHPHVNLVCNSCGGIQDLQEHTTVHVESARAQAGFQVEDFRLEYYGHCAECARKTFAG